MYMRQTELKHLRMIIILSKNFQRSVHTGRNTVGTCYSDSFSRVTSPFLLKRSVTGTKSVLSPGHACDLACLNSCAMKQDKMTSVFNVVSFALLFQSVLACSPACVLPQLHVLYACTQSGLSPLHFATSCTCPLVYADHLERWYGHTMLWLKPLLPKEKPLATFCRKFVVPIQDKLNKALQNCANEVERAGYH